MKHAVNGWNHLIEILLLRPSTTELQKMLKVELKTKRRRPICMKLVSTIISRRRKEMIEEIDAVLKS